MREEVLRTAMLLGEEAVTRLQNARVAVFGIGGVGGYVVEALARAGVGAIDLIDNDDVSLSNINRQILATHSTVGMAKVDAGKHRILDINPDCRVTCHQLFFNAETAHQFDFTQYDYIVDAIDLVSCKLDLIEQAQQRGIPILSALGTGNKLDASLLQVSDISKTSGCPLARVMRKELRERGIRHLKVVFSPEQPAETTQLETPPPGRRSVPASVAWVPSCAGLMMAGTVVQDLIEERSAQV